MSSEGEKSNIFIYLTFGLMIITGACNTIFTKLQNNTDAKYIDGVGYNHPWFQTFNMFVGEFYCFIAYLIVKNKSSTSENPRDSDTGSKKDALQNEPNPKKPRANRFIFIITTSCDILGTTLLNFALINLSGSVFQMLRGGVVLITSLFSVIFLKRPQYRHHLLGVFIVFVGVFLVGLGSLLDKHTEPGKKAETNLLGIVLLCISLLFTGCQFIIQEKILSKYEVDSLELVAFEGIWGLVAFAILLPVFQFITCSNFEGVDKVCSANSKGEYKVENTIFAFKQIGLHPILILWVFGSTVSIGLFNYFGINITKYVSAASRAVMDNSRTILVWICFLITGDEHFIWLQLVGFAVLVCGTVIYNELVEIPICGCEKFTRRAIKERESEDNLILK